MKSRNKRSKKSFLVPAVIAIAILVAIGGLAAANWSWFAVQFAPRKQMTTSRSDAAEKASALMWKALRGGDYERIPLVLTALTGAYLENPNDATTAAHVGFVRMWRLAERARLKSVPPTIADDAVIARRYFQEAVALNPADARFLGFLGSAMLAEGSIHRDDRVIRQGYFTLRDAIKAWPEFNLFTAGYSMSRRPAESPQFQEALEWQWRNVDACANRKMDRKDPDFTKYDMATLVQADPRACGNSVNAPHNWEGFFLNLGDMLVKAGEWQTGQKAYANARLSPDYASWKFRDVLEERITRAQANVALFNEPDRRNEKRKVSIMVNSAFSCVACHQK
jgi:hypothetical protein